MLFHKLKKSLFTLVAAALLIPYFSVSLTYAADEEEERKYENVKTKQRQAVGQKCGKKLEAVQEILEAENWSKAQRELEAARGSGCESSYENSQVWNFLGYVYYSQERYQDAIRAYTNLIKEPDADERMKISTQYTIAQLYFVVEDYAKAKRALEEWMKISPIIGSDAKVLLAQACYQLEDKGCALRWVEEAISEQEAKGNLPKEGWWSLQRVLYYEKNNYPKVVSILKKLIKHYPKYTYWRQIGGMYGELNQELNQLVATEVAYLGGDLNQERQQMSLAYMFLGAEAPFLAARIIDKGMKNGTIEKSADNLEVLGLAWQQAQDSKRALPVLEQAAKLSGKGKLYGRLAGVYLDLGENKKSVVAARNALRRGGLKRTDLTQMALGNALLNLHCYSDAQKAFRRAAKDKRSEKYAKQWIQYAEREGDRRNKLREAGAKLAGCTKV